ncbi:TPA: phage virion morphogenesis protein [Klebsiella pneumoniae]|nr:phage virion morphogenesis protein [Klebsiella pneumoniae]
MSNDPSFHQLDEVFAAILEGASVQGRLRMARGMATMLRQSQSRRIGKQEDPDGTKYEGRRRKVLRARAGIKFMWQGQERSLRNWRTTRSRRGRMVSGFDVELGAQRSFYREDIERYLDINLSETRRNTTTAEPMFRRLRTARFLKSRATADGVEVGYSGVAARIARAHQEGLRDRINDSGATADYPRRELLGLSKADRTAIFRHVINSLEGR